MTTNTNVFMTVGAFTKDAEKAIELDIAMNYELLTMQIAQLTDKKSSLEKKATNTADYTEQEIEGFKSTIKALAKELKTSGTMLTECTAVHDKVIEAIAQAHTEDGIFTNNKTAVRQMLRIVVTATNRALRKYVMLPIDIVEQNTLYDSLSLCHTLELKSTNEHGSQVMSKDIKTAYATADKEIQTVLRKLFSISIENEYTGKMTISFNKADMRAVHECYVTGIKNKLTTTKKEGKVTGVFFDSRELMTLATKKTNKDKTETIDYSKLYLLLCDLVVAKIAQKKAKEEPQHESPNNNKKPRKHENKAECATDYVETASKKSAKKTA